MKRTFEAPARPAASVLDLIGQTPLVRLGFLCTPSVTVYGKLEGTNPGGSVKDRAAHYMIGGLLERGELRPGQRLIEATSGNTGIALAMIARLRGLDIELVMPENATAERVRAAVLGLGDDTPARTFAEACRGA